MNEPKKKRAALPAQRRQSVRERQRGMRRLLPWQRLVRLLLLFIAVAATITYLDRVGGAFSVVESRTVAMRMSSWKGSNDDATEKAKQRVVMVPISDETFRDPAFSDLAGRSRASNVAVR